MANKKISQFGVATIPLSDTDVLPVIQGGVNKKVQVKDLRNTHIVKVHIPTAQVLTLNATPVLAVASPGAGYALRVIDCFVRVVFNSIAYTTHLDIDISTDTANNVQAQIVNGLNASISSIRSGNIELAGFASDTQIIENKALYIFVDTGNPVAGDSDIDVYITYEIITL